MVVVGVGYAVAIGVGGFGVVRGTVWVWFCVRGWVIWVLSWLL